MSKYRIVRSRMPLLPWLIGLVAAVAIVTFWPRPEPVGFRPLCEAQGGIVVRTGDGRLCLWAGAVIPVVP